MKKVINITAMILLFGALGVICGFAAFLVFLAVGFSSFFDVGNIFLDLVLSISLWLFITSFIFVPYVFTLVLTVRYVRGKMKSLAAKIVLIVLSIIWLFVLLEGYGAIVSRVDSYEQDRVIRLIPVIYALAILSLAFNKIKLKKTFFFLMLGLVLVFVIGYVYLDSHLGNQDEIMLDNSDAVAAGKCLAFDEDSQMARLEGDGDTMPVVDGAAVTVPMYSVFI